MRGSSNWPIREAAVDSLRLDIDNVRIQGGVTDEATALQYLFDHENAIELVADIARDGYYDNEQPIVYEARGELVVLEGNRRVAALKALLDPEVVPSWADRIRARAARGDQEDFPTAIRVMNAPSREAALPVIGRLHTRESKRSWILEQQAAFYYGRVQAGTTVDQLRIDNPADRRKIPRFITMGEVIRLARAAAASDPVANAFINSREFKATTLEYLYRTSTFRDEVGFVTDRDGFVSFPNRDEEFTRRLFIQILLDMKNRQINTRTVRVSDPGFRPYVLSLIEIAQGSKVSHDDPNPDEEAELQGTEEDVASSSSTSSSGRSAPGTPGETRAHSDAEPSDRPVRERLTRAQQFNERLDFTGMPMALDSQGMRTRWEELQRINVRRLPNATVDVIRTFVECAIKHYFEAANDPVTSERGPVQLRHCLQHAKERFSHNPRVARVLNLMSSGQAETEGQYLTTARALNDANHDPEAVFTPEQVQQMWSQLSPLIRVLLAGPPRPD